MGCSNNHGKTLPLNWGGFKMELLKYITANPVKKYMTSEEITMMFTSKKNYREDEMIDIKEENIFSTN